MQIPKQQVIDFIKSKVGGDKASQADSELPDQVDTDRDAGLLQKFGVDPQDLLGGLGGGGGLGSKLGL
ncbi:hypothetical protein [Pseudokineococcus marinus]|uniref:Uncharacterized protein n=1 Tax=Pseudokineococcus marinus TaxID=351215 RepID=A0A849BLF1_9ACTN|nr:hypothetical protein [Pseudokineococcus marinus]NNH22155.1 hypothetical protein [Pseudokineococcus marinus]